MSPTNAPSQLLPLFTRGINLAHTKPMPSSKNKQLAQLALQRERNTQPQTSKNTVFFHIPYHPKDPISWSIQRLFRQKFLTNCNTTAGFQKMTIAYSRPKNLGEMLSYRRIDSFNCPPVSSYFATRDPWARFFRSWRKKERQKESKKERK